MVIFASSLPSNSGCGNVCVHMGGGGGSSHALGAVNHAEERTKLQCPVSRFIFHKLRENR